MGQSLQRGYKLFITNGDAAGELLRKGFTETEVLPWRDVLHDGPVPLTEDIEELSELRADFIAERGWGDPDVLRQNFAARDRGLAHHQTFEEVTLWFEHDLYDQLQLIQILAWFADNPRDGDLAFVQSDDFLGTQSAEQLVALAATARPVADAQVALAKRAWDAYRQPTPEAWAALLHADLSALPYLGNAVRRALQELPDVATGLARTQHQVLVAINGGVDMPKRLFGAVESMEEAAFMGDWSFWWWLDGMARGDAALIEPLEDMFAPDMTHEAFSSYVESPLKLSALGFQVLGGAVDYASAGMLDRWMGGTHVTNDNLWRWNDRESTLVKPG